MQGHLSPLHLLAVRAAYTEGWEEEYPEIKRFVEQRGGS
jgi:hypothetical protein